MKKKLYQNKTACDVKRFFKFYFDCYLRENYVQNNREKSLQKQSKQNYKLQEKII